MSERIEHLLRRHHDQFTRDHDRLRDALMAGLPPGVESARTFRPRRWLMRSAAALAASVGFGIALWYGAFSGPRTLHAEVLQALKKAGSVHLVGKDLVDGQWTVGAEVWYERGRGVREEERRPGLTRVRIDDGTHQWRYDSRSNLAGRSRSTDPLGVVAEAIDPGRTLDRSQRDPSGDCSIDGVPCKLYVSVAVAEDKSYRYCAWIDADRRIRRFKGQTLCDGAWSDVKWIEAEYDVPVDAARFAPDFGRGVEVVDGDRLIEERFSPKQAVYVKEALGSIVAVNELRRVEGGLVLVVFSTRPTKETLRRFGVPRGSLGHGDLSLGIRGGRAADGTWYGSQVVSLAGCFKDGVKIQWNLVKLHGPWPASDGTFPFGGILHTRGELKAERERAGLPNYEKFYPMASLPLPKEPVTLDEVIGRVHADARALEPSVFQASLYLGLQRFSEREVQESIRHGVPESEARRMSHLVQTSPSRTSRDEYERAIRAHLAGLSSR
jgi:hypothetical protein